MTIDVEARIGADSTRTSHGGVPARRAMARWAWRLFRREWRQQLLILALVIVASAGTILGAAVSTNSSQVADFGVGTAQHLAFFQSPNPSSKAGDATVNDATINKYVADLRRLDPHSEVIENRTLSIPGSINSFDLRAENPSGAYLRPMLSLVSGHFPTRAHEVALTSGVASAFNVRVGDNVTIDGVTRRVVGLVVNPQSLLDEFALVLPGQVTSPSNITVLFDGRLPSSKSPLSAYVQSSVGTNGFNPETITIAALVLGMTLLALVSIGGFTVLAQRRLRSIGMIESLGATDRHVRFVVRANGLVVGVVGSILGVVLGFLVWFAYRPHLEQSSHHDIGLFAVPWLVVVLAVVLGVAATFFAASRPARLITKVPIVSALSGRPAPPRQIHRSAIPGVAFFVGAFLLLGYAGAGSDAQPHTPELVLGLVALIPGIILLSPFFLTLCARVGRSAPVAVRLALRDLSRYRARSGSALSAISVGILIAVVISLVSAARFANVLDYAGPNMTSSQLNVYTPNGPYGPSGPGVNTPSAVSTQSIASMQRAADSIAASLSSHKVLELETTSASLNHNAPGRSWSGPVFVATPALLRFFGISPSSISPHAEILTMRPGLSGLSQMQLTTQNKPGPSNSTCSSRNGCQPNPLIQEVSALPSGTSVPNTVITEYAVHKFHLHPIVAGWMIQVPAPLSASQITSARLGASAAGLSVESKSSLPSSNEVIDWATFFGVVLALGVLAMSVGLIRSETASELRILSATGASSRTRRALSATTAGALGLLGAVLGILAAYVGVAGWIRTSSLNGGLGALSAVPAKNLLIILVGMPLVAAIGGWIFSGRQPPSLSRQPIE
ncbi:MAG: FtsX-like permease family protein [Acidimicrobiales bacterium]